MIRKPYASEREVSLDWHGLDVTAYADVDGVILAYITAKDGEEVEVWLSREQNEALLERLSEVARDAAEDDMPWCAPGRDER